MFRHCALTCRMRECGARSCSRVPTRLEQDIQHVAIGIDRPPEPGLLSLDRNHDLFAHQTRACATDPGGKLQTEARDPVPHGLVGNGDPAGSELVFDDPEAGNKYA